MEDTVFRGYIEQGGAALGKGRYQDAIALWQTVVWTANASAEQHSAAKQQMGIALRLDGDLNAAEVTFAEALQIAPEKLVGHIRRDMGMVWVDRAKLRRNRRQRKGLLAKALECFKVSQEELSACDDMSGMWLTETFVARVLYLQGKRKEAAEMLHRAYVQMRKGSNRVFELNCLIWLAMMSVRYRWIYRERMVELIRMTGHTRRLAQYIAILAGFGCLYKNVR